MKNNDKVRILDHPLIQHKLSMMRCKETKTAEFRQLMRQVAGLMAYEITGNIPLNLRDIETPLETMQAPWMDQEYLVLVSILRAGNGLLNGMLDILPEVPVGHIGLYREPKNLVAIEYYLKLPTDIHARHVIVLDPMLATGHSAVAAMSRLQEVNPQSIQFLCLLAAPEGIAYFHQNHPEIPIITAAIDRQLNENSYIVPGLGDAGDRLYGTQ